MTAIHATTLMSRVAWTAAHVGLGLFWSVIAMQQFGTAWATALSDAYPGESSDHVGVY